MATTPLATLGIPTQDQVFKTSAVSAATGVTARKIEHWVANGYITPHGTQNRGSGSLRLFTLQDAVDVAVVNALVLAGVTATQASKLNGTPWRVVTMSRGHVTITVDCEKIGRPVRAALSYSCCSAVTRATSILPPQPADRTHVQSTRD